MRLTLFFTVSCLLLFQSTSAQYSRSWEDGKLTFEDFQGPSKTEGDKRSELKLQLRFYEAKEVQGDTIVHRLATRCRMSPFLSWIDKKSKADDLLRYNQLIFDIGEWHRRKLQRMLDSSQHTPLAVYKLKEVTAAMERLIDSVEQSTGHGNLQAQVTLWEERLKAELYRLAPRTQMPTFHAGPFSYLIHAGVGTTIFTEGLGESFRSPINAVAGLTAGYRRLMMNINTSLGFGSVVLKTIAPNNMWQKGMEVRLNISDASIGYRLVDNRGVLLAPFAGISRTAFKKRNKQSESLPLKEVITGPMLGLSADFKLQRILYPLGRPLFNGREYTETCLRLKLFCTNAAFAPDVKGYTINFSLGLSNYGRFLK